MNFKVGDLVTYKKYNHKVYRVVSISKYFTIVQDGDKLVEMKTNILKSYTEKGE
jgi:hypothetical protein